MIGGNCGWGTNANTETAVADLKSGDRRDLYAEFEEAAVAVPMVVLRGFGGVHFYIFIGGTLRIGNVWEELKFYILMW